MRILHVFPLFGKELTNGSEHYEYMLSKKLVELGVSVDVFATRSKAIRHGSAFSASWIDEYDEGLEQVDGLSIHRFASTFSIPPSVGYLVSRFIFQQWTREEERYGVVVRGSPCLDDHYHLRAKSRSSIYDCFAMLARGPWSASLLRALVRSIERYDLVLVGFMPFALLWQVTRIAKLFRKPVVILPLFHSDDVYHHFRAFYRCFTDADAVLAQTSHSANLFRRLCPGSRPVEVGAGVDDQAFRSPDISGRRFISQYGLQDKRVVLFVGRKERSKRYDLAIDAVGQIHDHQVKLVMIGADVDRLPIDAPHVLYLGKVSSEILADAYDACDVFLLPSEYESFGMVLLQAWMRKKPVIGNALCKPVSSIIQDGHDGYLCSNVSEMATRISTLLSQPSLAKQLGENGYTKVMERYTWNHIGRKVYNCYNQVIGDRTPVGTSSSH